MRPVHYTYIVAVFVLTLALTSFGLAVKACKAPQLDMISFGPTMRGVHSPDERLDIASTERWWRHLVALLENTPQK